MGHPSKTSRLWQKIKTDFGAVAFSEIERTKGLEEKEQEENPTGK